MESDTSSDKIEYYLSAGGKIMQRGKITTSRYICTFFVENYYEYADEAETEPTVNGYRPASEPTLYSLEYIDVNDFEADSIVIAEELKFDEEKAVDEQTLSAAKIKVEKTLGDLYAKRDTSQDVHLFRKYNTYDATFEGVSSFEYYSEPNDFGMNAKVVFTIKTQQGFVYKMTNYLIIEPDGNSFVITGIY